MHYPAARAKHNRRGRLGDEIDQASCEPVRNFRWLVIPAKIVGVRSPLAVGFATPPNSQGGLF
jgi:hypothetical protein